MNDNTEYYVRRAGEERNAATKAPHPNARQAHLDMAARYEALANTVALASGSSARH